MENPSRILPPEQQQGYVEVLANLGPSDLEEERDYLSAQILTTANADPTVDLTAERAALRAIEDRLGQ